MQGTQIPQSKNFTFTFFEKLPDWDLHAGSDRFYELCELETTNVRSIAFAQETCPKTGRQHYQGFLQVKNKVTRNGLKDFIGIPHLHLEIMRGNILENEKYCSKEGELVLFGPKFIAKGGRSDLQEYYQRVKRGDDDLTLADYDFGVFARTLRATDRIRLAVKPKRDVQRELVLLYGKTDQGKTRLANQLYPDLYEMPISEDLWFDGYYGQKVVLFDEFAGEMRLTNALKLFDAFYVRQTPVKGGFTWFNPDVIVITSNNHPSTWYDFSKRKEQEAALRRRFTKVISWTETNGIVNRVEYTTSDAIKVFWPIEAQAPQPGLVFQAVVLQNPIEIARANGTLCAACNTVPCSCTIDVFNQEFILEKNVRRCPRIYCQVENAEDAFTCIACKTVL